MHFATKIMASFQPISHSKVYSLYLSFSFQNSVAQKITTIVIIRRLFHNLPTCSKFTDFSKIIDFSQICRLSSSLVFLVLSLNWLIMLCWPRNDLLSLKNCATAPGAVQKDVGLSDGCSVTGSYWLGPQVEVVVVAGPAKDLALEGQKVHLRAMDL